MQKSKAEFQNEEDNCCFIVCTVIITKDDVVLFDLTTLYTGEEPFFHIVVPGVFVFPSSVTKLMEMVSV